MRVHAAMDVGLASMGILSMPVDQGNHTCCMQMLAAAMQMKAGCCMRVARHATLTDSNPACLCMLLFQSSSSQTIMLIDIILNRRLRNSSRSSRTFKHGAPRLAFDITSGPLLCRQCVLVPHNLKVGSNKRPPFTQKTYCTNPLKSTASEYNQLLSCKWVGDFFKYRRCEFEVLKTSL